VKKQKLENKKIENGGRLRDERQETKGESKKMEIRGRRIPKTE